MKMEKTITINLGNYQSLKVGCTDAPTYEECDQEIINELIRCGINVDEKIHKALNWAKRR